MSEIKKTKRSYLKLMMAVPLFVLGGLISFAGQSIVNPFVIVIGFALMAIGVMVGINWWQASTVRVDSKAKELERTANCLNIYPDHVEFAYMEEPLGFESMCRNDGKYYYVHSEDKASGELRALSLPDEEAVDDPQEFANPVTMPCNKKYFSWYKPEFQKVSMIIVGVVILFELIALIALGGE